MPSFLIVNADDFNLTPGVTQGILEAHRNGIVTSTTVMVNLSHLEESCELARDHAGLGVGLHLNLTFGPPVLPPAKVPSLVDERGRLLREPDRLDKAGRLVEIRGELAAQADRFAAAYGRLPSHLDTHHHIHRHPRIFEVVLELAERLGVPIRSLSAHMTDRIRRRRLPAVDRLVGDVGVEPYWTPQRLRGLLENLPPGVTEVMCHPGHPDEPLRASSYRLQREVELLALCDGQVKATLAAAGIRTITYADLPAIATGRP